MLPRLPWFMSVWTIRIRPWLGSKKAIESALTRGCSCGRCSTPFAPTVGSTTFFTALALSDPSLVWNSLPGEFRSDLEDARIAAERISRIVKQRIAYRHVGLDVTQEVIRGVCVVD